MKRFLIFLVIVLAAQTIMNAQVPRKVLMEYATNASCGPCAASNPGSYAYFKSNYDHIVAVWYHAWWPGSGDPMYVANIPENRSRIEYYGVNGVPNYMIDGVFQGNPGNVSGMASHINTRYAIESPISLTVSQEIVGDTLDINIELTVVSEVTAPNLLLRTAVVEQMLKYNAAPGSNGEKEFPQVFRKFCDGVEGIELSNLNVNDKLTFNFKELIDPEWKKGVLGVVTWVQSEDTKEVLQAESTIEITHNVLTQDSKFDSIPINETVIKNLTIENYHNEALDLKIFCNTHTIQESWECTLVVDGSESEVTQISLGAGESKSFQLLIRTSEEPGEIDVEVGVENVNSEVHFCPSERFYGLAYGGDVLLMDGDNGADYEQNYVRILNKMGKSYSLFEKDNFHKVSSIIDMSTFKYLVWVLGPELPALDGKDLGKVTSYLTAGGNLFIAGQDLGHDIYDVQNNSSGKFFFRFNLDAKYLYDSSEVTAVEAVEGNPLFDDFSFELTSDYPVSADVITREKDLATPILKYAGTDNYAMLIHQRNDFKTAYMTFGLDQIPSEEQQDMLVEKVFEWFDTPTGTAENSDDVPFAYAMGQNYPNPFNPATVINYQLADAADVKLSVYNTLGEEVAVLVDGFKNAGYYSVSFHAANLSSGIYFYKISANDFYQVNKMLLLK